MSHFHKCDGCGDRVECSAPYERNYDGWPEVVCRRVMDNETIWCEDCATHGVCEDCGKATAGNEQFPELCDACAVVKANPDEPMTREADDMEARRR